jgi:hypothetical protein
MKKIVITNCLECPELFNMVCEPMRCRRAKVDRRGLLCSRYFTEEDNFPEIPSWCPLEDA